MSDGLSQQLAALRIDREPASPRPPSRWRWLVWLAVLAALVGAAWAAVPRVQARLDVAEVDVTQVGVVSTADSLVSVTATGHVAALRVAELGAEALTHIVRVNIQQGQSVSAGDVLFEFDSSETVASIEAAEARVAAARARVRVARAQLDLDRAQLERQTGLVERGIGNAGDAEDLAHRVATQEAHLAAAESDVHAAAAEVEALREQLGRFTVTAPFDGLVLNRPAEVGAVADPTRPVVELMDIASLVVETDIPEARMAGVSEGAPCEVVFDAWPDQRYAGTVTGFAPRMDRARATATAWVRVEGAPRLLPDMAARVRFLREAVPDEALAAAPRTFVPASALVDVNGSKAVYVIEGETVRRVVVTIGEPLADGFELVSGPSPGTRLVQSPPPDLREGQLVRERQL